MRITESPMLPEVNDAPGGWTMEPLPPFDGGDDAALVEALASRINTPGKWALMSKWAILAFVRAVRAEFPDGGYKADRHADQDALAKRVGYQNGTQRLRMSRLVMSALTAEGQAVRAATEPS